MPSFCLKKIGLAAEIVAAGAAMFLSACGDSGTTEQVTNNYTTGLDIVASAEDLPKCTDDNEGDQALVKDENAIRYCLDGKWVALEGGTGDTVYVNGSDTLYVSRVDTVVVPGADTVYVSIVDTVLVSNTDTLYVPTLSGYSCETKALADSSGIAIYCGGDSIGVVYNGVQGTQGEAGAGCSVASSTDTTVTVKCGDDSFVMKLNGGSGSVIESSSSETYEVEYVSVTGVSQKGPFVNGSKVTLYELVGNRTLSQTGRTFGGNITTNDGKFTVNNVSLVSGYARLEANGFYRNEVTGKNSNASITLNAYTDLGDRQKVNVNLLTHLEYYRVNYLMANSDGTLKVKTAKKQAEREILRSVFGIDASSFGYSEDLDVFGSGDGDAALLALSILLQEDRSEADLTALLTAFGQDIQADGVWDGITADNSAKTWRDSIADWALEQDLAGNLATYRINIVNWGLGEVPAFEKYIREYYGTELGIGVCGDGIAVGTVLNVPNKNSSHYASSYTGTSDAGGKTRYICDNSSKVWRVATNIEKDTMGWGHDFSEGDVRNGRVNANITYVYEDGNWRLGTSIDSLMYKQKADGGKACIMTALNDTSKVKANDLYYVCSKGTADIASQWVVAPTIYNDTYEERSKCGATGEYDKGQIISGRINADNKYTCDADTFRVTEDLTNEKFLGKSCVSYLLNTTVTSSYNKTQWECKTTKKWTYVEGQKAMDEITYEGQPYKTVGIGYQLWFAENLNYVPDTTDEKYAGYKGRTWCYENSADSCAKYGRLYTWAAAMDSAAVFSDNSKGCGYGTTCTVTKPARGICPEGWHIPSDEDWSDLFSFVGGISSSGTMLKSAQGWENSSSVGCDTYGFSVLPAGTYSGSFLHAGYREDFWSSTEKNSDIANDKCFYYNKMDAQESYYGKLGGVSIRCLKNSN